ncbi:hypothetical protein DFJ73DRAFT_46059 [Zopfochytrium polystomum]|nr:hypothetical protein DFJ73DRAFT_46059 [Zopfochytrium polystomum]
MNNKENVIEQWHPECYTVYKLWNVRVICTADPDAKDTEAEMRRQQTTLEKVSSIYNVLAAFEESSAECIVDMLTHFSKDQYQDGVIDAARFIAHVNAIFKGISNIEKDLAQIGIDQRLQHKKDPKHLAKKIVNVLSLLSMSKDRKESPKELAGLVTSLAKMLKSLIRAALSGALKLELKFSSNVAVNRFLDDLAAVEDPIDLVNSDLARDLDSKDRPDFCRFCQTVVDEACFKFGRFSWHSKCFRCSICDKDLVSAVADARFDPQTGRILCVNHATPTAIAGAEAVSQLQHLSFLLVCALKRLARLLGVSLEATEFRPADRIAPIPAPNDLIVKEAANTGQQVLVSTPIDGDPELFSSGASEKQERNYVSSPPLPAPSLPPADGRYLSEILSLDRIPIQQQAVKQLEKLFGHIFSPGEIADFANVPKQGYLSRVVAGIMGGGKRGIKSKEGIFGVPLEVQLERSRANSDLGPGPGLVAIPKFVDVCLCALKKPYS